MLSFFRSGSVATRARFAAVGVGLTLLTAGVGLTQYRDVPAGGGTITLIGDLGKDKDKAVKGKYDKKDGKLEIVGEGTYTVDAGYTFDSFVVWANQKGKPTPVWFGSVEKRPGTWKAKIELDDAASGQECEFHIQLLAKKGTQLYDAGKQKKELKIPKLPFPK